MELMPVNYFAVLLAALANMGLGALWYGPLFGARWQALAGISNERMRSMPLSPAQAMLGGFVGALLMAYVFATIILFGSAYTNTESLTAGIAAAIWLWLGFVAPITAGVVLWEGKSVVLWALNAGYYLVALLVMGLILSLWI